MPPVAPPIPVPPIPPQRRAAAVHLHPFQPGPGHGPILNYVAASIRTDPIKLHPLLACEIHGLNILRVSDFHAGSLYSNSAIGNCIEHPAYAVIWVDEDATETELVGDRDHPATMPRVEELYCAHPTTGWCIRVRNPWGVTVNDVLHAIFEFFATPLYVDEMAEMHPRAVRVMEQRYFEQRALMGGMNLIGFEGYRKADALLGRTFFNGLKSDGGLLKEKWNMTSANVFILDLDIA